MVIPGGGCFLISEVPLYCLESGWAGCEPFTCHVKSARFGASAVNCCHCSIMYPPHLEGGCKATLKRGFKLPWREADPPVSQTLNSHPIEGLAFRCQVLEVFVLMFKLQGSVSRFQGVEGYLAHNLAHKKTPTPLGPP